MFFFVVYLRVLHHVFRMFVSHINLQDTMKNPQFYLLLLVCLLFSCVQRPDEALATAESLMVEYPDSALQVLQSIPKPHKLTGKHQADYCLLLSQAMDRNDLPLNDSLLNVAFGYYQNSSDAGRKAKTYFYQGRYHYELQEYEEATAAFKEAEKWALRGNDDELASLIYNHLGYINNMQGYYEKALTYFQEALRASQKLNNTTRAAYNMQEIAKVYRYMNRQDSASIYYERLTQCVDLCDDELKRYVYNNIGAFYLEQGEVDKALEHLHLSLQFNKGNNIPYHTYAILGEVYEKKNDREQAEYYWQKALSTDYLPTKAYIHYTRFSTMLNEQKYKEAALSADSTILIIQAANNDLLNGKFMEIQEKYDNESLLVEVLEHELNLFRTTLILIGVVLTSLLIFFFYRKYRMKRESEIRQEIVRKETELNKHKYYISTLEYQANLTEEEKEKNLMKQNRLEQEVKALKNKIKDSKKQLDSVDADKQVQEAYHSIIRGRDIYLQLLNPEQKLSVQSSDVFLDIISYFEIREVKFTDRLKTANELTNMEKVICFLFWMGLKHQDIASYLAIGSESLTRYKNNIKHKFGYKDSRRLEKILLEMLN